MFRYFYFFSLRDLIALYFRFLTQISTKADGLKFLPFLRIKDYLARSNKFLITNLTIGDNINFYF